jgi:hypothetical protein
MDIMDILAPEQRAKLQKMTVLEDIRGYVFRAHFPSLRRSGKEAERYVELLLERQGDKHTRWRWRWRTAYLHNNGAIFWDVPPEQHKLWRDFAVFVEAHARARAERKIARCNCALSALDR